MRDNYVSIVFKGTVKQDRHSVYAHYLSHEAISGKEEGYEGGEVSRREGSG